MVPPQQPPHGHTPEDLADALRDIDGAEATALEDDFPIPSAEMLGETRALLHRLYEAYPYRYAVYPSGRGEMVIYAQLELGRSIMLVRHPDGRVQCVVCVPGSTEPIAHQIGNTISDDTLREAVAIMSGQVG